MFASSTGPRSALRRRGIVLVLVLGMLGLMALIGVTFATFAGQSLKNGRNFSQGLARPQAEALMDYALAQLINDTNNPLSAIRGHSLLRDMYGNDSTFRGLNPLTNPAQNSVAETGGVLSQVYDRNIPGYTTCHFTNATTPTDGSLIQYTTSIPTTGPYSGYDFTRWTIRFAPNQVGGAAVPQTFEILADNRTGAYHVFTLAANLMITRPDPNSGNSNALSSDSTAFNYMDANRGADIQEDHTFIKAKNAYGYSYNALAREINNPFVLDGRYMRAFNGPGLTRPVLAVQSTDANVPPNGLSNYNYPYNLAAYGNMRVVGLDPDLIGMDEDYDACDLENWFLAVQSADGQVMIPSFHRPGILTALDWTVPSYNVNGGIINTTTRAKILRPRQVDNSPLFPADPSVVDSSTQQLTYDIDNDGDGVTDSVWLDLGYPTQRDPNGKLYKPLFAFMVLGLNGRMPLNTVGNLQARAIGDRANNTAGGYAASTGQVPYAGIYTDNTAAGHAHLLSSQVYFDAPLYDHTSHLGYSVNEINPKFALQNAPANLYASTYNTNLAASPYYGGPADHNYPVSFGQLDDAGVPVALTQLRNLLAGTVPTSLANPYTLNSFPINQSSVGSTAANGDLNFVYVNGQPYLLPNSVADYSDLSLNGNPIARSGAAVPGRWGEPAGVPALLPFPAAFNDSEPNAPMLRWPNPVRAGKSYFLGSGTTLDSMDDDFDSMDPYLPNSFDNANNTFTVSNNYQGLYQYTIPINYTGSGTFTQSTFTRRFPEEVDTFDNAGQVAIATERARRYSTPQDTAGVGRQVAYMHRPTTDYDYGNGTDARGRTGFFRYFRPAGLPQRVHYPYPDTTTNGAGFGFNYLTNASGGLGQQFLAPVLIPAGHSDPSGDPTAEPNVSNNVLRGYQALATPDDQTINDGNSDPDGQFSDLEIASMGAMPFDVDPTTGSYPAGYPNLIQLITPTTRPPSAASYHFLNSNLSSETGPNLGATGASSAFPIPYVPNSNNPNGTVGGGYAATTGNVGSPGTYDSNGVPSAPMVVNGYLGGSLNKDEADEMNLYAPNSSDMAFGPSDLEWLYRKHDVDGATLNSRLAQLAPVSFLNPADGLTRRRMFSTDAWDLTSFAYANDNPIPYAGVVGFNTPYSNQSSDHDFTYNSRFMPYASSSQQNLNQIVNTVPNTNDATGYHLNDPFYHFANPFTTEFLPNATVAPTSLPLAVSSQNNDTTATPPATLYNMFGVNQNITVNQTPSLAHRDRKLNLNFPLPISNDPAEPIRQKWCRETYRLLKSILPPASVDTPEELAALSQFVVNIVDFRDTDCTTTRFVNTDLIVTDALTKQHDAVPAPTAAADMTNFDRSPQGVRFATTTDISANLVSPHFPYDPSLYSPDVATKFLVQHGMEYNPIALNEVLAVQYQCNQGSGTPGQSSTVTSGPNITGTTRGLFIEMFNTLTEAQNNSADPAPGQSQGQNNNRPSLNNSSTIDLTGWDLIIAPDEYGWGRPDPITGDVSQVAWPPQPTTGNTTFVATPPYFGTASANTTVANNANTVVQQYRFTSTAAGGSNIKSNNKVRGINGSQVRDYYIAGGYTFTTNPPARPGAGTQATQTTAGQAGPLGSTFDPTSGATTTTPTNNNTVESAPIAVGTTVDNPNNDFSDTTRGGAVPTAYPTFDVVLPQSFIPFSGTNATPGTGKGTYFWVYLRRPANPFDTADLTAARPNREMVVVDSMRFSFCDLGMSTIDPKLDQPKTPQSSDIAFSAQRLQPYRGGHLAPVATTSANTAAGTICPPSPAYAYGYSEQTVPPGTPPANQADYIRYVNSQGTVLRTTPYLYSNPLFETIGRANDQVDSNWANLPFHDRDFASVAELLLVPGCPPGLFTKQFVEEPYPGHASGFTVSNTSTTTGGTTTYSSTSKSTTVAKGWDSSNLSGPTQTPAEPELGRKDFGNIVLPAVPTFPYLTDNFYYTAASVAPPLNQSLNAGYTHLTTEVGGWTGTGWHRMLEFFEVPSSANGAIGTADQGNNFDWYRADLRPGQVNLNLIMDEEVFAGVLDDPRLNENLAVATPGTTIPLVVSQIDVNGYPAVIGTDSNNLPIYARSPMFRPASVNATSGGTVTQQTGRGYVIRDPNVADYPVGGPYGYQLVHGLKAAFSDFLKLRHGGSGHIFGHGAGDVGMGDVLLNGATVTQPIAADRPYRSLSYPDINYTIMRPASLPPTPVDTINATPHYPGTLPILPGTLTAPFTNNLPATDFYTASSNAPAAGGPFIYTAPTTASIYPYLDLNLTTVPSPYIQDPGVRNPFLDIQYNNSSQATSTSYPNRRLAPPYDVTIFNLDDSTVTLPGVPPAPFPPTIPPTPARRLFQIPDFLSANQYPTSNASLAGQHDSNSNSMVNVPTMPLQLWTGGTSGTTTPPTLVPTHRAVFAADNYTPQSATPGDSTNVNNYLGEGVKGAAPTAAPYDLRQHPVQRTEWLQKISNLTTVRTHQFAVWITVGFFEVVRTGTPELGIPDVLGQELSAGAGRTTRYRSFFVLDRTRATGFNPYYPGNFRDCVTYRRRIE